MVFPLFSYPLCFKQPLGFAVKPSKKSQVPEDNGESVKINMTSTSTVSTPPSPLLPQKSLGFYFIFKTILYIIDHII